MSLISLGAMLELAKVCANENHFEIRISGLIRSDFEREDNSKSWARIEFLNLPKKEISLGLLEKVKTNRFPYLKSDIRPESAGLGENIYFTKDLSKKTKKLIVKIEDEVTWKDSIMLRDTFRWIRTSRKAYEKLRDGFYYPEINLNMVDAFILVYLPKLFSHKIFSANPLFRYVARRVTRTNLEHTDTFAIVATSLKDSEDWIELGSSFTKLRFLAASKGMESQPLSASSLPYIFSISNFCSQNMIVESLGKELQVLLKKDFNLQDKDLFVAWLFRIGAPYKTNKLSLRKNTFKINGIIGK
ncbi:MAG: hypothetical protein B7Y39_09555 [Bdellovibrio sp. 28-41-41]|nr:MAG: hypothetical protein B7Y39_09555 [Bdellovibrio sp. 28-41-41]